MTDQPRLLVVDDDADLRDLIAGFLIDQGLQVETAADAAEMDAALARQPVDLIVLDLMMPGEDGLSIVRRLRGPRRPGVIMLSAMGEDLDRIIGLEVGADDYLPKPCNPRELLARIRAVLRRRSESETQVTGGPRRRFGNWTLDLISRTLTRPGQPDAQLTDAEFRVLTVFLDRPQRVLSRDQLLDAAKGQDADIFDRAIDVTVSRLRRKLGPGDPIRTIRNEGYMFAERAEDA
ncbi:response regulator [Sphingomonas quercus]|uniref:Response regulator n=1 Tax=Sphingomonas quercus TaxID=2842451 RepID=A0ABS6BMA9_9SPHN|nr:response regulator [Sphingomonas quercus]MBU3078516.1 response regulator [Sphingomonas quercus]